jgi:tRNA (guanine37-N1)-methyltransferase
MEVSLGDFVLTGGEMACIPIVDSILRLVPGVLSSSDSFTEESFYSGALEYPHYTRPAVFEGDAVPEVLMSGHHENVRKWRRAQSLIITRERRPDLFEKLKLSDEDKKILKNFV